jgi:hypothetical protein
MKSEKDLYKRLDFVQGLLDLSQETPTSFNPLAGHESLREFVKLGGVNVLCTWTKDIKIELQA